MTWTIETLQAFYEKVRRETGIHVEVEIVETTEENQSPVAIKLPNYIHFSSLLFNHPIYSNDMKVMMALWVYSEIYLRANKKVGNISVNPEALAKGLCDKLGTQYIPIREINLLAKQIGALPFSAFFDCASPKDYYNKKIDLRRNLFILSGPSGCGKTTVFHELKKRMPEVQRAITVTTRNPRGKELHGVDYYFYSDEDFLGMVGNNKLAEYTIYDNAYYGTPFFEIEKHTEKPVFLIIDTKGKRKVTNEHYPLATSIFLMPPSVEEAMRRLASRNENSYDEIERRCRKMEYEIRESVFYDYIVENDDLAKCVDTICSIIEKTLQQ